MVEIASVCGILFFFCIGFISVCLKKSFPFGFLYNEPDIHILTSLYNHNYTMLRVGGHLTSIYKRLIENLIF